MRLPTRVEAARLREAAKSRRLDQEVRDVLKDVIRTLTTGRGHGCASWQEDDTVHFWATMTVVDAVVGILHSPGGYTIDTAYRGVLTRELAGQALHLGVIWP